ncbi:hypothetical protein [Prevotella histicola]|jgi:hypothetical protein|uniref:hypothetical protein n=1 Tax=Prevotella histicola TaxID=470565 RepID=UPI001C5E7652|nr:hypothetical protein [Prevotella histicola]MBS6662113.1 hypothetical protein [Prevotella histicola]MBW4757686.1 hypothetical protein [Prevotella histicola]
MSYQINEFLILNQLQDLTSANEIITMLHLISQGKREIQTQKSHIATLCGQRGKDKNNNTKLVNKIIKGLTEKGYLTSTSTDYILIKGINKTTTKWVLSDKAMNIIKSLNSKQKQAKTTSKIKTPTQAYQATTKEAKEATKEQAPQTHVPTLAELQAAIKI